MGALPQDCANASIARGAQKLRRAGSRGSAGIPRGEPLGPRGAVGHRCCEAPTDVMNDIVGSSNRVRVRFLADHAALERLFAQLLTAAKANDGAAIAELGSEFEERLTRHLEAEERFLVPQLFAANPREARTILEEHRHIRSRLLEVGFGVHLRIDHLEIAGGFLDELRAHARHEDEMLYRWADGHLTQVEQSALIAALGVPLSRNRRAG
jgi:hypothetical protein